MISGESRTPEVVEAELIAAYARSFDIDTPAHHARIELLEAELAAVSGKGHALHGCHCANCTKWNACNACRREKGAQS